VMQQNSHARQYLGRSTGSRISPAAVCT
jgi:hypothetical protein